MLGSGNKTEAKIVQSEYSGCKIKERCKWKTIFGFFVCFVSSFNGDKIHMWDEGVNCGKSTAFVPFLLLLNSYSVLVLWIKKNNTFSWISRNYVLCEPWFIVCSYRISFTLFGLSTQKRALAETHIPILCFCILQGNWNAPLQSELGVSLYIFLLCRTQIVSQGIHSLFFQHLSLIPRTD